MDPLPTTDEEIARIALCNPRLAYVLATATSSFAAQVYELSATFVSGSPDTFVDSALDTVVSDDFWVRDVDYQVEQPNAFPGSLFKGQADYYTARQPNIDVLLSIQGPEPTLITPQPAPVQHVGAIAAQGWVVQSGQQLAMRAFLRRALSNGQIPTKLTVAARGLSLGVRGYNGIPFAVAVDNLRALGLLPKCPS